MPVVYAGLATTAASLFGVYWLNANTEDFNIMGWYANYVASWMTGVKITRRLLWTVLALQAATYVAAQYIEFRSLDLTYQDGSPVSFLEYYDIVARSFAWEQRNGEAGEPLGMWGYLFRGLEVIGFLGGGLIVPFALRKAAYCDNCQIYMRSLNLATLPAAIPAKKFKKSQTEEQAAHQRADGEAVSAADTQLESLRKLAAEARSNEFLAAIRELKPKKREAAKLPRRIVLQLVSCHGCHAGSLRATLQTGQGNAQQATDLGATPLPLGFARIIRSEV
jgi:hypothetical protein